MSATTEPEIPDVDIVEPERGREVAIVPNIATLAVTPSVQASELVARLDVIKEAMQTAMVEGIDYGRIPGVDKPTLFKPGAEKLGVLFQLDVQPHNEKTWGPGDHLTVVSKATVYSAVTGQRLGFGEGICTTREKKYGKRMADRACPACGKPAIKRSKFPPRENPSAEPGWYCFAKVGGCGANYAADDPSITSQAAGEVENPDLPDMWNTVDKMASKRARVDAVLAVTGASALFTQDAEDMAPQEPRQPSDTTTTQVAGNRPTAATPQATERPASGGQRTLIRARATEAVLSPAQLANALLVAAGQRMREFESDDRAAAFVDRQLDRLPGRLVDAVLTQINEMKAVAA